LQLRAIGHAPQSHICITWLICLLAFDPVRALVERRAAGWSRSRVRAGEQRQFCGRILNLARARRD
jgi:hypothetical protein